MRLRFLCVIVLAVLSFHSRAWAQEAVTVLLSEDGGAYAEFASQLGTALGQAGGTKTSVRITTLNAAKNEDLARSSLTPAFKRLHAFVEKEYLPRCRDTAGLSATPNGADG